MALGHTDATIRRYLGLRYRLVGVELRREGIGAENPLRPSEPVAFCHAVRVVARTGRAFLYDERDEKCYRASICLGLREPEFGEVEPRVKPAETKAIFVAPLDQLREEPDVVLAILNPKQLMDATAVLRTGGFEAPPLAFGLRGENACGEFAALPYMEREPRASFLCHGSRTVYSDYRDEEFILGAPPGLFAQLAEGIGAVSRITAPLCGCRVSDLPPEVVREFEGIGFAKSTDYFFGQVGGRNVRVFLNRDAKGRLRLITVHVPVKMPSEGEARAAAGKLQSLLRRPYAVGQRESWLDVSMTAGVDELSVDIRRGEEVAALVGKVSEEVAKYLARLAVAA